MTEFDLAQLRHAYAHLAAKRYDAGRFVLASVIRSLEKQKAYVQQD